MRKNLYLLHYLTIVLLTLLSACADKPAAKAPPSASNAAAPSAPRAIAVDGFVVRPQPLEEIINTTGNLIAYEAVEIRPERSGKILELHIEESSIVSEGKLLAQIDDSELQAQKERLNVELDLAKKEVARGRELLTIQGVSAEEMDRLINRVEAIKAEKKVIDVQIEKSRIYAPFSGVLGLRQVSKGAYVTPNDAIIDLKQVNPIKLEFDVPEKFLTKIKVGQLLKFTIVGATGVFEAKVYALDNEISPLTRTFKVRALASNKNRILKPGQFAKITVVTGINNNAMLIPTDAVIPVLDGKQVFVANKGRAIAQKVQTSDRQATEVEIIEGISIGDTVIVSGLLSLTDGAAIQVDKLVEPQNLND